MIPASLAEALAPVTLVVGHYGVGKTNFTLNLALDLARSGMAVKLVDLDVVNPYFRSSEYRALLADAGVDLIAPTMANTSVDLPSLSAGVDGAFEWARSEQGRIVLVDVGGDDAGATALGRYSAKVSAGAYAMFYVVNHYRNLTRKAIEALEILDEIQIKSGLRATAVVNNSHLKHDTTLQTILDARAFGQEAADLLQVPMVALTRPILPVDGLDADDSQTTGDSAEYPVQILVTTPWEQ